MINRAGSNSANGGSLFRIDWLKTTHTWLNSYAIITGLKSCEWSNITSLFNHIEIKKNCYEACKISSDGEDLTTTLNSIKFLIEFLVEYMQDLTPNHRRATVGELEGLDKIRPLTYEEIINAINTNKMGEMKKDLIEKRTILIRK